MVRRPFALNTLSFVGNLQNLDKVSFLCLIASLQSSLYHGLLFFGLVEVFGMHFSLISISEEVKSAIRSERVRKRCSC